MAVPPPAPGIRVVETCHGAYPLDGGGAAVPAFIGLSPAGAGPQPPVFVRSWNEFRAQFPTSGVSLSLAVRGYFANSGHVCCVVPVSSPTVEAYRTGLAALKEKSGIGMVCAPEVTEQSDAVSVQREVVKHCAARKDRIAVLDVPDGLDTDAACRYAGTLALSLETASYAALYYPWLLTGPLESGGQQRVPPCGHVAGTWVRSDRRRGVHKAPANTAVVDALAVSRPLCDTEHGQLHEQGVNCIRTVPRRGVVAWGARTLSPDLTWRHLPVRRLVNTLHELIRRALEWTMGERNTYRLRAVVRGDITVLLTQWWSRGALCGATPQQAFTVTCDDNNNPSGKSGEDDAGPLRCDVRIAPLRPAEFITFQVCPARPGTPQP